MPPRPISRTIRQAPMRSPTARGSTSSSRMRKTGVSMKSPISASEAASDSTSRRSSSSPWQAATTKSARSDSSRSKAPSKTALICCQRSGVTVPPEPPAPVVLSVNLKRESWPWNGSLFPAQLPEQPEACRPPLPFDRGHGDRQDLRDRLVAQAHEEPHLDDPALARVDLGQPREGFVQGHDFDVPHQLGHRDGLVQRDVRYAAAPFRRLSPLGVVHQDAPHQQGRHD